jgi:hypothetical protein
MSGETGNFQILGDQPDSGDTVPNLALEDTTRQLMRGFPSKAARRGTGGNPYDSTFPNTASHASTNSTQELRKLSEWIRQKRQAEQLKAEAEQHQDKNDKQRR